LTKLAIAACQRSLIKILATLFSRKATAEATGKTCQSSAAIKQQMKDQPQHKEGKDKKESRTPQIE
jgi:hypothetical protein